MYPIEVSQLPLFESAIWTITELSQYLREQLESDPTLQDLSVRGEVSNLSRPSSGHMYFTLKDRGAALRCVMWRSFAARQNYIPQDGDAVQAHGSISVYEQGGVYQLYVDSLRPYGAGLLFQAFLQLKTKLEAEGLFDAQRKRPVPRFPHTIGVVTSPTGAALRDILNTLQRRYPLAQVVLASTAVQGENAPDGIVAALGSLNRIVSPDVILLARGGGSIEDLWAFNDENVARAIAASAAPVISGVGHETDFTIADFVADLRAPTPTAAAELATPDRSDLEVEITAVRQQSSRLILAVLARSQILLNAQAGRLERFTPLNRVRTERQRLDEYDRSLSGLLEQWLRIEQERIQGITRRLSASDARSILARGFAMVTSQDGRVVSSTSRVKPGDQIDVRVLDGTFPAQVMADESNNISQ